MTRFFTILLVAAVAAGIAPPAGAVRGWDRLFEPGKNLWDNFGPEGEPADLDAPRGWRAFQSYLWGSSARSGAGGFEMWWTALSGNECEQEKALVIRGRREVVLDEYRKLMISRSTTERLQNLNTFLRRFRAQVGRFIGAEESDANLRNFLAIPADPLEWRPDGVVPCVIGTDSAGGELCPPTNDPDLAQFAGPENALVRAYSDLLGAFLAMTDFQTAHPQTTDPATGETTTWITAIAAADGGKDFRDQLEKSAENFIQKYEQFLVEVGSRIAIPAARDKGVDPRDTTAWSSFCESTQGEYLRINASPCLCRNLKFDVSIDGILDDLRQIVANVQAMRAGERTILTFFRDPAGFVADVVDEVLTAGPREWATDAARRRIDRAVMEFGFEDDSPQVQRLWKEYWAIQRPAQIRDELEDALRTEDRFRLGVQIQGCDGWTPAPPRSPEQICAAIRAEGRPCTTAELAIEQDREKNLLEQAVDFARNSCRNLTKNVSAELDGQRVAARFAESAKKLETVECRSLPAPTATDLAIAAAEAWADGASVESLLPGAGAADGEPAGFFARQAEAFRASWTGDFSNLNEMIGSAARENLPAGAAVDGAAIQRGIDKALSYRREVMDYAKFFTPADSRPNAGIDLCDPLNRVLRATEAE